MNQKRKELTAMPRVKQRRVNSKAATNRLRWLLKKKHDELLPMPRPQDMENWEAEAVKQLRENAGRLGL